MSHDPSSTDPIFDDSTKNNKKSKNKNKNNQVNASNKQKKNPKISNESTSSNNDLVQQNNALSVKKGMKTGKRPPQEKKKVGSNKGDRARPRAPPKGIVDNGTSPMVLVGRSRSLIPQDPNLHQLARDVATVKQWVKVQLDSKVVKKFWALVKNAEGNNEIEQVGGQEVVQFCADNQDKNPNDAGNTLFWLDASMKKGGYKMLFRSIGTIYWSAEQKLEFFNAALKFERKIQKGKNAEAYAQFDLIYTKWFSDKKGNKILAPEEYRILMRKSYIKNCLPGLHSDTQSAYEAIDNALDYVKEGLTSVYAKYPIHKCDTEEKAVANTIGGKMYITKFAWLQYTRAGRSETEKKHYLNGISKAGGPEYKSFMKYCELKKKGQNVECSFSKAVKQMEFFNKCQELHQLRDKPDKYIAKMLLVLDSFKNDKTGFLEKGLVSEIMKHTPCPQRH